MQWQNEILGYHFLWGYCTNVGCARRLLVGGGSQYRKHPLLFLLCVVLQAIFGCSCLCSAARCFKQCLCTEACLVLAFSVLSKSCYAHAELQGFSHYKPLFSVLKFIAPLPSRGHFFWSFVYCFLYILAKFPWICVLCSYPVVKKMHLWKSSCHLTCQEARCGTRKNEMFASGIWKDGTCAIGFQPNCFRKSC